MENMEKDQNTTKPKIYQETRYTGKTIGCEKCRHELESRNWKVCPYCGRKIEWEKEKDR